jgi:hypothetical protein
VLAGNDHLLLRCEQDNALLAYDFSSAGGVEDYSGFVCSFEERRAGVD